jgi:hypothetical protein
MIDAGSPQVAINERVAGLIENTRKDIDRIGSDHEKRIRYLERTVTWALGGIGTISGVLMILSKVLK